MTEYAPPKLWLRRSVPASHTARKMSPAKPAIGESYRLSLPRFQPCLANLLHLLQMVSPTGFEAGNFARKARLICLCSRERRPDWMIRCWPGIYIEKERPYMRRFDPHVWNGYPPFLGFQPMVMIVNADATIFQCRSLEATGTGSIEAALLGLCKRQGTSRGSPSETPSQVRRRMTIGFATPRKAFALNRFLETGRRGFRTLKQEELMSVNGDVDRREVFIHSGHVLRTLPKTGKTGEQEHRFYGLASQRSEGFASKRSSRARSKAKHGPATVTCHE